MSIEMGVDDYFRELALKLIGTSHGEKSHLIEGAAATFGLSRQNVYRRLRAAGWRSGRKLRQDKGDARMSLDEARVISGILDESTRRGNGKRLLGVADAMAIAEANKLIDPGKVTPSTAMRILRLNGLHPEQLNRPSPHMPLASLHPNHVWQFDASVCVLFYLRDGALGVMDEKKFYKNKPDNLARVEKNRVWRYLVTDHYSGAFYVEYFLTPGENQETLFNFLMSAFFKREHEQDPLHGVPLRLVWDAGSANQSYLIRNLLDQLDVAHYAHVPGNPRAKGQVEVHHNIVERKFEGRLPMMRITSLAQLNHHAHIWMREFNANFKHSRHGNSRYGLWQTIRREHLRVPRSREVCEQLLHTKPETRKVQGNLVVSYRIKGFETMDYSVVDVPGVRVGDAVEICVNPYRAPNIDVLLREADGRLKHIECEPLQKDAAGFIVGSPVIGESFRAAPDTATEREKKNLVKLAYGADTLKEAEAKREAREPAFGGLDTTSYLEAQTRAHYMRRPGVDLDLPDRSRPEAVTLSATAAAIRLVKLLDRALTVAERDRIDALYPQGVPEDALADLAARLAQPDSHDNVVNFNNR